MMDDQRRLFLAGSAAMTMGASLTPLLAGCGGSDSVAPTILGGKPTSSGLGGMYFEEFVSDLIGTVALVAFSRVVPRGWQTCDGQLLPINQYQALYSLLQIRFGGDGVKTFALPKLAVPEALNPAGKLRYLIAVDRGLYPSRS